MTTIATTLPDCSTDALFGMWAAGELSDLEALRTLCDDLRSLDDALATLTTQRESLREQIGRIVAHSGGRVAIAGIGRLELTAQALVISYERTEIDALIIELTTTHPTIAARLASCRCERVRAGGLRITSESGRR